MTSSEKRGEVWEENIGGSNGVTVRLGLRSTLRKTRGWAYCRASSCITLYETLFSYWACLETNLQMVWRKQIFEQVLFVSDRMLILWVNYYSPALSNKYLRRCRFTLFSVNICKTFLSSDNTWIPVRAIQFIFKMNWRLVWQEIIANCQPLIIIYPQPENKLSTVQSMLT